MHFALIACSGGGLGGPSGGLQHLDGIATGLDSPGGTQNQAGPAERPGIASDMDPQEGVDVAELRETCKPFLDANNKAEAPQRCQDYWDFLTNNANATSGVVCIVGSTCPKGQTYTVEPPPTIVTQPATQVLFTNQGGDGTTYQYIPTYGRQLPEGFLLHQADDDDN